MTVQQRSTQQATTQQVTLTRLDQLIGRLLFIQPQPVGPSGTTAAAATDGTQQVTQRAERAFGASLIFSGVRCILQYVILPFILPLIGVAADAAVSISLVINALAIVLIFYSLRRFWQIGYRFRWQYLGVAVFALILLGAFILLDVQTLLGLSIIEI
jgi:hypothetical protein